MRVYVAGPMRGLPAFNFPAFDAATQSLRDAGHEVFNPAERDISVGLDPTDMTGHEDLAAHGFSLREALGADVDWIAHHADAICLLPGWEQSSGARAEMALAAALGLQAGTLADFQSGTLTAAGALLAATLNAPALPPSGEVRVTSATGGQKGSKPQRYDLIPPAPLRTLAELYGRGAQKYDDNNWRKGYRWSLSFAALNRHLWQFWGGQDNDDETGLPHLASVAWHAFALLEFATLHPQYDDRPPQATS